MNFIFGFLFAVCGFVAASINLNQKASSYWDFVAFAVVAGGTVSVLIMTRPKTKTSLLLKYFSTYLFSPKKDKLSFVKKCFKVFNDKSFSNAQMEIIEEKIIADGLEMIDLGFEKEKIENILTDRYIAYKKTIKSISAWIKRCAKYPPAFGLGGTVLGLIHLMNGLASGSDAKEIGVRMAVALVATFYGLLLSNLILNPISEAILEKLNADEELVEIAIKTILMMKDQFNLIECQEALNSHLADEIEKINFLTTIGSEEEYTQAA